jgi:hypothetical protein
MFLLCDFEIPESQLTQRNPRQLILKIHKAYFFFVFLKFDKEDRIKFDFADILIFVNVVFVSFPQALGLG